MSATFESVANQGEFRSKVAPSNPITTKGHAPGVRVGNDAVSEFSAQTLPAGTAPPDRTFKPNPNLETLGQANNDDMAAGSHLSASDTINGANSADVHQGLGMPVQGQSSRQLHGSGLTKGKREKNGLAGVGADPRNSVRERALDIDVPKETRGKSGVNREDFPGAEEREPVSAEGVAAETAGGTCSPVTSSDV